mgnify:CR=1 FL=1
MQVYYWPGEQPPPPDHSVTTVGVFDGVHLGHQAILHEVVAEARHRGASSVVITFDRHPHQVLHGPHEPCITSLVHRVRLFEELGLDRCLVVRFTPQVAAMEAVEFARTVIRDLLHTRLLIVGPDWRFGRAGAGGIELCRQMAEELALTAREVESVRVGGEVVSSTAIRRAVVKADLRQALRLLGRPFSLFGTVARGAGRGRILGYPTADLDVHNELVPRDGVYATRACVGPRWLDSVTSVGMQRTFSTAPRHPSLVEVHIMDVDLDLYGQDIEVRFIEWLRGQKRFPSAQALAEQIGLDVEKARRLLSRHAQGLRGQA